MKKLIFLILPFVLLSCAENKAMMAEKTNNFKNQKVYFTDSNREILSVNINNVPHRLFFDTGAGVTMLYKPKFKIDDKKKIREKSVYGFDRKTKVSSYNYATDGMDTKMFAIENKYLFISHQRENLCDTIVGVDGLLGNFYDSDLMLELNYEQGYIQFIEDFSKDGWSEIDIKFSDYTGKFSVGLEVNGITDFFLFDTGNKTMTYLNKSIYFNQDKPAYTINLLGNTVGNSITKLQINVFQGRFSIKPFDFAFPVGIDAAASRSVLSKSFIEKFNWVIDKKNKKAYCKAIYPERLLTSIDFAKKDNRILSSPVNGKLYVSFTNCDSPFNVGDEIISVQNRPVTPENVCKISSALNQSNTWQNLEVKTIPSY